MFRSSVSSDLSSRPWRFSVSVRNTSGVPLPPDGPSVPVWVHTHLTQSDFDVRRGGSCWDRPPCATPTRERRNCSFSLGATTPTLVGPEWPRKYVLQSVNYLLKVCTFLRSFIPVIDSPFFSVIFIWGVTRSVMSNVCS